MVPPMAVLVPLPVLHPRPRVQPACVRRRHFRRELSVRRPLRVRRPLSVVRRPGLAVQPQRIAGPCSIQPQRLRRQAVVGLRAQIGVRLRPPCARAGPVFGPPHTRPEAGFRRPGPWSPARGPLPRLRQPVAFTGPVRLRHPARGRPGGAWRAARRGRTASAGRPSRRGWTASAGWPSRRRLPGHVGQPGRVRSPALLRRPAWLPARVGVRVRRGASGRRRNCARGRTWRRLDRERGRAWSVLFPAHEVPCLCRLPAARHWTAWGVTIAVTGPLTCQNRICVG